MVATGLGSKHVERMAPPQPQKVVSITTPRLEPSVPPLLQPTKVDYEKPAFAREGKKVAGGGGAPAWLSSLDESVLNIPTFLRQQAD